MEFDGEKRGGGGEEEVLWAPASPAAQFSCSSTLLSLTVLAIMETQQVPIDDSVLIPYIKDAMKDVLIPLSPRFSSIVVSGKWKRVELNYEDHIIVPELCAPRNKECYDEEIWEYISELATRKLDEGRPRWEIHILKYPSRNGQAGGTIIFRLCHSLGDGCALLFLLFSGLRHPSTFPALSNSSSSRPASNQQQSPSTRSNFVRRYFQRLFFTLYDFGCGVLKSRFQEDDPSPIRSGRDGVEFRPVVVTTMTFKLDSIKQIKNKLNVTVNDVITGIIMLGTRLYMKQESSSSANANCNGLVVIDTRGFGTAAAAAGGGYKKSSESEMTDKNSKNNNSVPSGNKATYIHIPVPKLDDQEEKESLSSSSSPNCKNSLKFIFEVHKMIKRRKNHPASVYLTGMLMGVLLKLRGVEAMAKYIHGTLRNSSFMMSNLIGPVDQMVFAGHPIKDFYFFIAGSPQSLVFLVVSYMGCLNVGVVVEKDFIDPNKLKACIETAFQSILKDALAAS